MALCLVTLGTHLMVPAGSIVLCAAGSGENSACGHLVLLPGTCTFLRRGEACGGYRSCLTAVCFLQGGREVSDFISYLKREATNAPVLQEEEKSKKPKKKVKEDL